MLSRQTSNMTRGRTEANTRQNSSVTPMSGSSAGRPENVNDDSSFWGLLRSNPSLLCTLILNPVLVLHLINGLLTFFYPGTIRHPISNTSIQPHLDVHANDGFCRLFTLVMVTIQSALYSSHAPKLALLTPPGEDGGLEEESTEED